MYDTIKLWLPIDNLSSSHFNQIAERFNSPQIKTDYFTGEIKSVHGKVLGMDSIVSHGGLYLNGSICKSYLKDNFQTLTRQDTARAIEQISDTLLLPISKANVFRLDIAQNFFMEHQVENYYSFLGECCHFKRLVQPKSIYYQNGLRTMLFYNKVEESKSKGLVVPIDWKNKHVLRYELRFTKRLTKQFNVASLLAKDLYENAFYNITIKKWLTEYNKIRKIKLLKPDAFNMTSKEGKEYLLATLIQMQGQSLVINCMNTWKEHFKNEREFYRFMANIKSIKDMTEPSELIDELNTKIRNQAIIYN